MNSYQQMKIKYLKLKNWLLLSAMSLLGLEACHCHKQVIDNDSKIQPDPGMEHVAVPMYGVPMDNFQNRVVPPESDGIGEVKVEQPQPNDPQVTVYGVPTVDFAVKGKVLDGRGRPVKGAQVVLVNSDIDPENLPTNEYWQERLKEIADTTDALGTFEVRTTDRPWEQVRVLVRDVDGKKNGWYQDQLVDVSFGDQVPNKDNDGGPMSKWRQGVKHAEVTVKLKNKK